MKNYTIIHRISLVLLTLLEGIGALVYLFKFDVVAELIGKLGFPSFIVVPLAIAKLLGLVALWSKGYPKIKEWAYAGFTFDFLLAIMAHLRVNDGEFYGALMALVILMVAYITKKK